jgi:hypothetical protein
MDLNKLASLLKIVIAFLVMSLLGNLVSHKMHELRNNADEQWKSEKKRIGNHR